MISIDSPMGRALLNHREGDRVRVKVNENVSYYVQIRRIQKSDDESEAINKF
jgi:transcription elongation factor GreA